MGNNEAIKNAVNELVCNHVIGVADNRLLIYQDELQDTTALDEKFKTVDRFNWQSFNFCPRCGARIEWIKKK